MLKFKKVFIMTSIKITEDTTEIAAFTDINRDVDRSFIAFAIKLVVVAALIISILGSVMFCTTHFAMAKTASTVPKQPNAQVQNTQKPTETPTEKQRIVLLDAGHGGFDPGTAGKWTGIYESEINLQITNELKAQLEAKGYVVLMTRTDANALGAGKNDDMMAREAMIQRSGADIFISIHQNAFENESTCGAEVYYNQVKPESVKLAECIERALQNIEGASPTRGVKQFGHQLTKFMRYSVLIECGFLTNQKEEAQLTNPEYQKKLAAAIVLGVDEFYDTAFQSE